MEFKPKLTSYYDEKMEINGFRLEFEQAKCFKDKICIRKQKFATSAILLPKLRTI